jgi:CheY-like chemotaxis protein
MTRVLVVDDSAVDRRLVGEFLTRAADLQIDYATDGREALQRLEQAPVDLILTDLLMPGLNGLELVRTVSEKYPLVPIILMTSQGNEETAVQALHDGAASYVSKRTFHQKLLTTVNRVLAIANQQRTHSRLMGCLTASHLNFCLENDSSLFAPLVAYLQEAVTQMGLFADGERMRLGVALEEALSNALYHGNLGISSELREESDSYYAVAEDRMRQAPYRNRRLQIEATLSREKAVFVVRDEGQGFDPSILPDPTDPANLEKASGRGIFLMRTFMDDIIFNNAGNVVTLVKLAKDNHAPHKEAERPAPT